MEAGNSEGQRVLVIGASGSFGGAVTQELVARGWDVACLKRPGGRPITIRGVSEITGDAGNAADVERAARGASVVVHGHNVPYPEWPEKLVPVAQAIASAAERAGALLVFPGNVYGLGPDFGAPLAEDCRHGAPSKKGQLRNRVEAVLERSGARVLTVRCGDFFGAHARNTWFHELTKKVARGGALRDPAPAGVPHEWAYLPDVGNIVVDLVERRDALAPKETFHVSTHRLTSAELFEAINAELPRPVPVKRFPWTAVKWLGVVVPFLRELQEMKYLWDEPVLLDDTKLRRFLPGFRPTPLGAAVRQSLGLEAPVAPAGTPAPSGA
jgi:nucleoside-diphosphate-sugar epimerase